MPEDLDHKKLKKLLQSSTTIHSIYLSESKFRTADWTTISEGMVKNKSVSELRLHSININEENIGFISNIIKAAHIESVRFDHWTIQPNSFDILCQSLNDAPKLAEIEVSRDSLTESQLQKLKSTFESANSIKRLTIFRDPVSRVLLTLQVVSY